MSDNNDEPKTPQEAVAGMLQRDPLFKKHYTESTHAGDRRPGADEVRANHEHALRIARHVFETWDSDPNRVQARSQAATAATERGGIESEIAMLRTRPGYLDRKHRDHDAIVRQIGGLYEKLNPRR